MDRKIVGERPQSIDSARVLHAQHAPLPSRSRGTVHAVSARNPCCQIGKPDQIDRLIATYAALGLVGRVELLRAVRRVAIGVVEPARCRPGFLNDPRAR
jgi:DNA-binding transcriptional regulator YbjK